MSGGSHVAMESTGVYWKPIYNLLEEIATLLVVNAQHIKAVPGRKTDVQDAEWIADLLQHGLLRASYIPKRPQRELRELTRYRTALVRERAAEVNRVQKVLEGANIKLASVASHTILTIMYHLLHSGGTYQELGGNFFDQRDRERVARRQVARLERLGYRVMLEVNVA